MATATASAPKTAALVMLLAAASLPRALLAGPGDILFADDFERNSLAPWTSSNNGRSGTVSGADVSRSPTRGGYTRRQDVTVTSPPFAAAVPAAELAIWVRRGSDAFSEWPDGGNEDLVLEYQRANGSWGTLRTWAGGGLQGEIFNESLALPPDALHASLAIRLRQTGGSGGNYDWWHFDDLVVTESGVPPPLDVGSCENFDAGLGANNWTVAAGGGTAGTDESTYASPFASLHLSGGAVSVTSREIDASNRAFARITLWVRRGSDRFSEDPDGGENLRVEYLNDSGGWSLLESFSGSGRPGQTFDRSYAVPADGRHSQFRLRLRQTAGSGPGNDFWHIDDVCFASQPWPAISISKAVATLFDPINGASNPKAIPGAVLRYTINVSNSGDGGVDADSLEIMEAVPAGTALYVDATAGDPVNFFDGAVPSGLAFTYPADVQFSSQAGGGPPFDYTPVPDAEGFDPAVRGLRITPTGAMNGASGAGSPSFDVRLDVRVQ